MRSLATYFAFDRKIRRFEVETSVGVSQMSGSAVNVTISDSCPICNRNVHPSLIKGIMVNSGSHGYVQIVFQCAGLTCQNLFIATYTPDINPANNQFLNRFSLRKIAPKTAKKEQFSESVTGLSPNFVEIYNQSLAAEAAELNQLNGIGLRKALEFLIKDYSVYKNPEKEKEIKETALGQCIKNYIDDSNVKACAQRAVWLGNDETHYVRKWEDKDINDLKTLIRLTVNWIENILLTEKYLRDMDG